jgi:hypothetical protein
MTSEPTPAGELTADLAELARVAAEKKWIFTARVCKAALERIEKLMQENYELRSQLRDKRVK